MSMLDLTQWPQCWLAEVDDILSDLLSESGDDLEKFVALLTKRLLDEREEVKPYIQACVGVTHATISLAQGVKTRVTLNDQDVTERCVGLSTDEGWCDVLIYSADAYSRPLVSDGGAYIARLVGNVKVEVIADE